MTTTPEIKQQALRPQKTLRRIHALRAGTHPGSAGAVTLTVADLAQIAEGYTPQHHEAPVVLGHPATDAPAWGWVRAATANEAGLFLDVDLQPELEQVVREGRYRKVSVSLYPPAHPANPTPGRYSLKHLGFLGATPPAVKGLQALQLSESEPVLTIEFSEKEPPVEDEEETTDLAEREQQLEAERAALERDRQALAAREKALRAQEWDSKLNTHVQAGRLLPADKKLTLAFCESLDNQTVDLGEGDKPQLDQFFDFLSRLPAQVELTELAIPEKAVPVVPVMSFSAPDGYEVDAADMAEYNRVRAWLRENPGKTYVEAIQALKGN